MDTGFGQDILDVTRARLNIPFFRVSSPFLIFFPRKRVNVAAERIREIPIGNTETTERIVSRSSPETNESLCLGRVL